VQHCDDEVLALAALGEQPAAADAAHLADCGECRAELESLRRTVGAVRVPVTDGQPIPPPLQVWDEIAAATGVSVTPRTVPSPAARSDRGRDDGPPPSRRSVTTTEEPSVPLQGRRGRRRTGRRPGRTLLLVAASALVVGAVGGAVGTSLLTPDPEPARPKVVTQVVLAALPVDPQASGEAKVVSTGSGRELSVDVRKLAGTDGFYEVWLIDRGVKKMIPLGILHGSQGQFAIPEGVDLGKYPIVDVSAEPLDGNPQHSGKSLLRGTIQG
jgi:hypothetical protein